MLQMLCIPNLIERKKEYLNFFIMGSMIIGQSCEENIQIVEKDKILLNLKCSHVQKISYRYKNKKITSS